MLQVNSISFTYTNKDILKDISFHVKKGEHIALIGESGCGKSTLLKIIYGLLHIDKGFVRWNEIQVMGPNYNLVPGESYMKYLSQDFDLMPFLSVEENISQYLSVFYPEKLKERTQELLKMIEMEAFSKRKVKNLSGGQQQRVALARVLAQEPEVLLLDEPFSHIDNFKKSSLRRNLFTHLKKKKITCIMATHDTDDILSFSDQIIVLKDGIVLEQNTPQVLYNNPPNKYVASLFGEVNYIPIKLLKPYTEIKESLLVFPHEFQMSENSGLKVWVKNSYFKGNYYLNEGMINAIESVFFVSKTVLSIDSEIFLNVSMETINLRMGLNQNGM
ncbi:MAG: ABC transporter ATP-binding protein [Cellulophaga sp.]